MRRRRFQKMLFFAGIAAPPLFGVQAQPKPKLRIGCVSLGGSRNDAGFAALFERLSEVGYVEGRNLEVDFVFLGPNPTAVVTPFRAVVERGADVLFVMGTDISLLAARIAAADRVPIVMLAADYDPVEAGYVKSLARPGGNLTGVFIRQPELAAKRVELTHELFPSNRRLIVWMDPNVQQQTDAALRAAQSLGLDVQPVAFDYVVTIETIFQRIQSFGSSATLLPATEFMRVNRDMICRMALERRIPLIAAQREFVEAGALISYGARLDDAYRQVADYISRIANGIKPADLPIEQPTRFELSVNGRTAREIGIALSPIILARADEVIE
jgi:putative tryptophan/tyrosine transport system substrate-binding protein